MSDLPLEDEFREFVVARSPALLRTAYLLAGDWATAEDVLQIALTKTYLAWKRPGGLEVIEAYARRVLVNTTISWWRRSWRRERPTEFPPEQAAPDRLDEQLERDVLWRHVKALPARQRAVLVLRFYEDMSEAQTAALLNIAVGTVKSQASRALRTLRQRLAADGRIPRARKAGTPTPTTPVPERDFGTTTEATADGNPDAMQCIAKTGKEQVRADNGSSIAASGKRFAACLSIKETGTPTCVPQLVGESGHGMVGLSCGYA